MMVLAVDLLDAMADVPDAEPIVLVPEQSVSDIIRYMPWKLVQSRPYYDRIWQFFEGATAEDIGDSIFDFLKTEMTYVEEDDDTQRLSTPKEMLERGDCDCKCYALFSAGVVDAINRNSGDEEIPWCFRFVPSKILGTHIGHVFVVLYPGEDEIWIDPVLDSFNRKVFYLVQKDKFVTAEPARKIAGLQVMKNGRIGSAESDLLSQLSDYQQGLLEAVSLSESTSTINSITKLVVTGITSVLVPEIAVALKVLSLAQAPLNNAFGAGSKAALIYSDITSFDVSALISNIFNGRTYNSDQYWGAAFYYFYVEGQNITNQDQVTDSMVLPALKWFIDRTGVFISGRQHIMGLIAGEEEYMSYASVNGDTTTDEAVVDAAVAVAQKYWVISGTPNENYATFDASLKGTWANTVGVFDTGLTAIAAQYGETAETYAAQTDDQYATDEDLGLPATDTAAQAAAAETLSSVQQKLQQIFSNPLAWVLTGAVVIGIGWLIIDE